MPPLFRGVSRCALEGSRWYAGRWPGGGTHGQTDRRHTHDDEQCDDKRDATYGIHPVISCPRCMGAQGCRSTPLCARPPVLCEGKKHAIASPARLRLPKGQPPEGDMTGTLLSGRGEIAENANGFSF